MDYIEKILNKKRKKLEAERQKHIRRIKALLGDIKEIYGIKEAYIVGSLASPQKWYEFSDIDVAISGCSGKLLDIMGKIEKVTGKEVDIIDLEKHPSSKFLKREGEKIYG